MFIDLKAMIFFHSKSPIYYLILYLSPLINNILEWTFVCIDFKLL